MMDTTCEFRFITNIVCGNVSLNCCGLECTNCGYQTMNLSAPDVCPKCGARVINKDGDNEA